MNFHLQFPVDPFSQKINHAQQSLFIGSCFAENIGELMQYYKFNTVINPHGVLYNPASIAVALRRYMNNDPLKESELFFANECWNSWEHHSRFSNSDKETCLSEINKSVSTAHTYIKKGDWLFITFGSAFIYTQTALSQLAGNCHKMPQQEFTKRMLSIDEIVEEYTTLIWQLKKVNSKLKIVFTVSPVRYIRDGVMENNLSKARLTEAVHQLVNQNSAAFYFPAYELVIDDLRDYRFYKTDLVHPNEQAIDYVFEKLMNVLFDEKTKQLFEKIKEIMTAKEHKPLHADTSSHQKFKTTYRERSIQLQKEHPLLDLSDEVNFFGK